MTLLGDLSPAHLHLDPLPDLGHVHAAHHGRGPLGRVRDGPAVVALRDPVHVLLVGGDGGGGGGGRAPGDEDRAHAGAQARGGPAWINEKILCFGAKDASPQHFTNFRTVI